MNNMVLICWWMFSKQSPSGICRINGWDLCWKSGKSQGMFFCQLCGNPDLPLKISKIRHKSVEVFAASLFAVFAPWPNVWHKYKPRGDDISYTISGSKGQSHPGRSELLPYLIRGSVPIWLIRFICGTNTANAGLMCSALFPCQKKSQRSTPRGSFLHMLSYTYWPLVAKDCRCYKIRRSTCSCLCLPVRTRQPSNNCGRILPFYTLVIHGRSGKDFRDTCKTDNDCPTVWITTVMNL